MVNRDIGGLVLIAVYIGLALVGEVVAYGVGSLVEARLPDWSLIVFLVMFIAVLIGAWPIALRLTRAYGEADTAADRRSR